MIDMKKNVFRSAAAAALITLTAGSAYGAMIITTDWGGGQYDIGFGASGEVALTPFLYVDDLAETNLPTFFGVANLDYMWEANGAGTSAMTLVYSVANKDPASYTNLRFMVDVIADAAGGLYNSTPTVVWGTNSNGEPDHYEVRSYDPANLLSNSILGNTPLNDTVDSLCGGPCDLDFALQWNLAELAPGEIWRINLGLSDDGSTLSPNRYLIADAGSVGELTFSGDSTVVPIPGAVVLLGSALTILGIARRKKM
jgi:hypothetical protein